jgi:N-acyl-D-aspartate/D-glutamate deacylase
MSQRDLERAVSRATGESVSTVRQLGFLLADADTIAPGEELDADVIDWDAFDVQRTYAYPSFPLIAAARC